MQAADARTNLMYAADSVAELSVSAASGCTVWYTTDGSTPEVDGAGATQMTGTTLSVQPTGNLDHTVTVKAVAVKDGLVSGETEQTIQFIAVNEDEGTKVYEGSAECPGAVGDPYEVKVRVTTVNGSITSVEDNGTRPNDLRDEAYWNRVYHGEGISAKLVGMNLSALLAAKTTPNNDAFSTDAVSGATISSNAVKYACVNALRSEPISSSEDTVSVPRVNGQYGYTVTSNTSYGNIPLTISYDPATTVYYTTDGNEPTQASTQLTSKTLSLYYEADTYPDGQKIPVKFAAFDAEGNHSRVVTVWVVFAKPQGTLPYEIGTYTGEADGVTASVTIANDYGDYPIIQSISLDEASETAYGAFLPELVAEICYQQKADIEPLESYDTTAQKKVLAAVAAAVEQAQRAPAPTFAVDPVLGGGGYSGYGPYAFDDPPSVTLSCAAEGAEIYYKVSDSNPWESPDAASWSKADGAITPTFNKVEGGTVYIMAAATLDGGKTWSDSSYVSIKYSKRLAEDAFIVDGRSFQSFNEAAAAVQKGGTIVVNTDKLTLLADTVMPQVACTITSAEGQCYAVSSEEPLSLNADLTLSNIDWTAETYLNGHDFTAAEGCYRNDWRFNGTPIYAGAVSGDVSGDSTITLHSGQFAVYGSGASGSTLNGNVTVTADRDAWVQIVGAANGATLNGDFAATVQKTNDTDTVFLAKFFGRSYSATVTGAMSLTIVGAPQISAYGNFYTAVEYWSSGNEAWGTLDLTQAAADFVTNNEARFSGFATVNKTTA